MPLLTCWGDFFCQNGVAGQKSLGTPDLHIRAGNCKGPPPPTATNCIVSWGLNAQTQSKWNQSIDKCYSHFTIIISSCPGCLSKVIQQMNRETSLCTLQIVHVQRSELGAKNLKEINTHTQPLQARLSGVVTFNISPLISDRQPTGACPLKLGIKGFLVRHFLGHVPTLLTVGSSV